MSSTPEIEIAGRRIGAAHEPFVICELSGNHNGSLDRALAMIDAAADTGCEAIKIQTHHGDHEKFVVLRAAEQRSPFHRQIGGSVDPSRRPTCHRLPGAARRRRRAAQRSSSRRFGVCGRLIGIGHL